MISNAFRRVSLRSRNIVTAGVAANPQRMFKSSLREKTVEDDGEFIGGTTTSEVISYPATPDPSPDNNATEQPVLLNSKEHVVGYLNRILNARVYEAAVETDLQYAENLSEVRLHTNVGEDVSFRASIGLIGGAVLYQCGNTFCTHFSVCFSFICSFAALEKYGVAEKRGPATSI